MNMDAPVVIVGAGPVGTTLAMDLARWEIPAIVLERRRGIPSNPRCNTTNARSMELLRRLGCADAVRAAGLPAEHNTDIVYMTRLNGCELARFERSTAADVLAGSQHGVAANWPTPEPQHFISQLYLEPVLRKHAVEHWQVDLREGWELLSFVQHSDAVECSVREIATAQLHSLRCRHLVGADGANSLVRRAIGAQLEGIARLGEMCSSYFRSRRVTALAARTPGWMLRFVGGGVLIAIDGHEHWLLHQPVPPQEDPATWDPMPAMVASIGEPFDCEIIDQSRWTPRALLASKWRDGNVSLAGDAAHLWVPMGGFGMNAGMADAVSLSWRIAGVLKGWADPRLLDSYEQERAPIGAAIARQAVTWAIQHAELTKEAPERSAALEQNATERSALGEQIRAQMLSEFECPGFQLGYAYADSSAVCSDEPTPSTPPIATEVEAYVETTAPGARLPHRVLADGSSLYDHLGLGFSLLRVRDSGISGQAYVQEAVLRALPLQVVDVAASDLGGAYAGLALVLVRPDQHIAWRSRSRPPMEPSSEQARSVLDCVTGRAS